MLQQRNEFSSWLLVSKLLYLFRVSKPPQTLDELGQSLELWDSLNSGLTSTEAKFPPLHDQFGILEKYEVAIPEDVKQMLNDLSTEWVTFQEKLIEAEGMLKKHKVCFGTGSVLVKTFYCHTLFA